MAQWNSSVNGTFNIGRNKAKRIARAEAATRRAAGLRTVNQERQAAIRLERIGGAK
jgi:hypothetical protein